MVHGLQPKLEKNINKKDIKTRLKLKKDVTCKNRNKKYIKTGKRL